MIRLRRDSRVVARPHSRFLSLLPRPNVLQMRLGQERLGFFSFFFSFFFLLSEKSPPKIGPKNFNGQRLMAPN